MSSEERRPYGPREMFQYHTGLSKAYGMPGSGPGIFAHFYYGDGGYLKDMPPLSLLYPYNNKTNVTAESTIANLIEHSWIDEGTRFVSVEVAVFNTMTSLLTVGVFQIELTRSGFIQPYFRVRTVSPLLTHMKIKTNVFRYVAEGLLVIFNICRVLVEVRKFCKSRPRTRYFQHRQNLEELVLIILYIGFFSMWYYRVIFNSKLQQFDSNSNEFVSLWDTAEDVYFCWQNAAVILVISSLKMFRYLNPSDVSLTFLTVCNKSLFNHGFDVF